jgi:hypothetical protein
MIGFQLTNVQLSGPPRTNLVNLSTKIKIKAAQPAYTVVLDNSGNAPAAYPMLQFQITNGPPNHAFDVQLSRGGPSDATGGAADLTGGPGLAGSWVESDGRDARMNRAMLSSWSNGQTTLVLDGSGKATYTVPLEWWRDQARQPRYGAAVKASESALSELKYHFRVVALDSGSTPVSFSTADGSSASPTVTVRMNLVNFRVVEYGYINGGTQKSIRMQFTVREANTVNMYTLVQWMQGAYQQWQGTPLVMSYLPGHELYGLTHICNFSDFTIDRVRMNPRYGDGAYDCSDGLTASATDAPGGVIHSDYDQEWDSIDFETRIHLNFEVPAEVTITRKDGSPPMYGVITGVLADPQPITLDSNKWQTRVLQVRQTDGNVTVTHPDTFAGP